MERRRQNERYNVCDKNSIFEIIKKGVVKRRRRGAKNVIADWKKKNEKEKGIEEENRQC